MAGGLPGEEETGLFDTHTNTWLQPTLEDPRKYWVQDNRNWRIINPNDPVHENRFMAIDPEEYRRIIQRIAEELGSRQMAPPPEEQQPPRKPPGF